MRYFLRICCFLILLAFPAKSDDLPAGYFFSGELQEAYHLIQQLKIQKAQQIILRQKQLNNKNGVIPYLENYADLHYLLLSEDKKAYTAFIQQAENRYNIISGLPESSYKLLFQADIKLHSAFVKLKFGNEISGCRDIIKAYNLLKQNRKKYPDFVPTLKSMGLLHVLIGSVPDQYTWVTKILGLNGNIDQGIKELKQVQEKVPFFRHEARLIDLMLHAYVLDADPKTAIVFKQWAFQQPENLLIHFLGSAVLKKEGQTDLALEVVQHAPAGKDYMEVPVMEYMKAEILLQQGNYTLAKNQYLRFLNNYKGFNFIKDSYFKIFICYWLTDQENTGKAYLNKVLTNGTTITEADQFAERFAGQYFNGQIEAASSPLFAARYYSDGGYQEKAVATLASYKESDFRQQVSKAEYNYRMGRIYQKSSASDKAIPYYKRAITLSEADSYYFGASAALQLGYIYEEQNQPALARASYKKAVSFKKHEYKNSIDNKAKAALSRLNR